MSEHIKRDFTEEVTFKPIGIIHSDYKHPAMVPFMPVYPCSGRGVAEIWPQFEQGLQEVEGFSHLHLLYYFHKAGKPELIIKPFLGDAIRGVFATRSTRRPNPIGLSVVRLTKREGLRLYLDNVDILDGTPLLDIKPFISRTDNRLNSSDGWLLQFESDLSNAQELHHGNEPDT